MEVAASALIIFALILPGLIFQRAYTRGSWRWNSPASVQPIAEQILGSVVAASLLHAFWTFAWGHIHRPDLDALAMLLLGDYGHEDRHFGRALGSLTSHPGRLLSYFISLYAFSAALGYGAHAIVRSTRADRRLRLLRFSNEWFYLLSGEQVEFPEVAGHLHGAQGSKWIGTLLSAVVCHCGGSYIYRGIVFDFFFDRAGQLDRVVLTFTHRRPLADGTDARAALAQTDSPPAARADESPRYEPLAGDYFILRYADMTAVAVEYIFAATHPADGAEAAADSPPARAA